ncbi:T3SS effector EspW [Escherichia coli]|nr:T3SS effector EspW [Escherichia coli]
MPKISSVVSSCYYLFREHQQLSNETTMTNSASRRIVHKEHGISLKSVPVWLATAKTPLALLNGKHTRSHSFIIAGTPGMGGRSGAQYYAINSDDKRSRIDIDSLFLKKLNNARNQNKFSIDVKETVIKLQGQKFTCIEDFHKKYSEIRLKTNSNIQQKQITDEVKSLTYLIPSEKKEMWIYKNNGKDNAKPNLGKRDVRMFENISPDDTDKITGRKFSELGEYLYSGNVIKLSQLSIRYLPNINSISLIETKQSLLLHRLYSDEVLQRNGTLIPTPLHEEKSIPAANIKTMLNNIPTYKMLPPFTETQGNCSSGAATFLRKSGAEEKDILACSPRNYGLHHNIKTWDPLVRN